MFSVVTVLSRGPEAEVETTVAGVRFDLGPGVGREGLSLRDPAAGLVDYSHWLTALRYLTDVFEGKKKNKKIQLGTVLVEYLLGARGRVLTRLCYPLSSRIEYENFFIKIARPRIYFYPLFRPIDTETASPNKRIDNNIDHKDQHKCYCYKHM